MPKKNDDQRYNFIAEDDLDQYIKEIMDSLKVGKTEAIHHMGRQLRKYNLEQGTSESENFKKIQGYFDKISTVFHTIADGADSRVEDAIKSSIEHQEKYEVQVANYQNLKEETKERVKANENEIKRLSKEVEKYEAYEESVEGRIADKELLIKSKDETIISLSAKINELEVENGKLDEFKKEILLLKHNIDELQDQLKQKEYEKKDEILVIRKELQEKNEERIAKIYDSENDKREKVRQELEKRLHEEHLREVERLRIEHQKEINRIRAEK